MWKFESLGFVSFGVGWWLALAGQVGVSAEARVDDRAPAAARRAIDYLSREVPKWSRENKCFSCHNNGDGARALFEAVKLSYEVEPEAIADTRQWLQKPPQWEHNRGDKRFSDKKLASLQFGHALLVAADAGLVPNRRSIEQAATIVAGFQSADGAWTVDAVGAIGSPATYGKTLATVVARHLLRAADRQKFATQIASAEDWIKQQRPKSVLDAAAVLMADAEPEADTPQRRHCLDVIRQGEAPRGGWGPFVKSAPEPFDTAVVLIALAAQSPTAEITTMIQRGRAYLIEAQLEDGGWIETTRPAGGESYAQRLSTTGWAAIAVMKTRPKTPRE